MLTVKLKYIFLLSFTLLLSWNASAGPIYDGMARVADWTDLEITSNEMPSSIWGSCDTDLEDRVGIVVTFDDGTTGSATYSGVSGVWNSSFTGINADVSTGFLASCTGLHFLHNNNSTLPMAWISCNMPFASNFDLDYNESNGSHFRANTAGWVSARIETYCGAAQPVAATAVPTLSQWSLITMMILLGIAGIQLRRKKLI